MYLNIKIFQSVYPHTFKGCIAFKSNPTAFNDPNMFNNLLRLIVYLQENQLSYNIIRF